MKDKPEYGKQYRLTGGINTAAISNGNSWADSEVKKCPACGVNELSGNKADNALSRYANEAICSDCGTREAFEGDFWNTACQTCGLRKSMKREGSTLLLCGNRRCPVFRKLIDQTPRHE